DAATLAAWLNFLADAASKGTVNPGAEPSGAASAFSSVTPALAHIAVWAATHCTGLASAGASLASVGASLASQAASLASQAASIASSLPSVLPSALASFISSAAASLAAHS